MCSEQKTTTHDKRLKESVKVGVDSVGVIQSPGSPLDTEKCNLLLWMKKEFSHLAVNRTGGSRVVLVDNTLFVINLGSSVIN